MPPQKNRAHGSRAAIALLALTLCSAARGGVLDFFKSPAELIMNQKNCVFMKQNSGGIAGEVLNGKFIFSPQRGTVVVLISMEKLDDNRVAARMERTEDHQVVVLDVKKNKSEVTAGFTAQQVTILFLECAT